MSAPVRRGRVVAGALLGLAAVAGMIALVEALRHPPSGQEPADDPDDPRAELVCPEPPPREGVERPAEVLLPGPPPPEEVTSGDLLDCPGSWDGLPVRYRGEVVGGVLRRSVGAWVQLNDDVYAGDPGPLPGHREYQGGNSGVGVLLPHDLADDIEHVGGPGGRGDVLEVVGTFQRVDPQTREVAVIRASEGEVAGRGGPVDDPLRRDRAVAAAVLAILAVAAVTAERLTARRAGARVWRGER